MRNNITVYYQGITRLLALVWLLLVQQSLFAIKDENTVVVQSGDFVSPRAGVYDTLRTTAYLPACINMEGVLSGSRPALRSSSSTISLLINPEIVSGENYEVTLEGYHQRVSPTQAGLRDSTWFTLKVNYASAPGTTYKQRDALTIPNTIYTLVVASIRVNGIIVSDSMDKRFRVEVNITGDMVYPAPAGITLSGDGPILNIIKEDATARSIKWSWLPMAWAEYYELEYLFIDNYKADGTRKERGSLRYNFRTDAVRLRITDNEYELPLVFEQGYIVARVRAIGFKGARYTIPVYGKWNLSDDGTIPVSGNNVFEITPAKAHEADRLNWQYSSGFNESGMRSEAVWYADGTSRKRQQVSALPEENKLLVTETLYDNLGRATINTLPAPIKPSASTFTPAPVSPAYSIGGPTGMAPGVISTPTGNANQFLQQGGVGFGGINYSNSLLTGFTLPTGFCPSALNNMQEYLGNFALNNFLGLFYYRSQNARIGYVPRFNVNKNGGTILRGDYDTETACDSTSMPLGTQSGAGRYYSPENPERSRWQAYVPDAEGYPYSQVKFTNDGTGKIREKSHPGFAYRMGGGRTQKLYYGTPSQAELDRYFGNDAGRSSFYKKTLLIDENGQGHVSIHNLKGNLVLSALTGARPENLEALSGVSIVNDTVDLVAENNVLNTAGNAWESTKRLAVAAATDLQLSYRTTSPDYNGRYCTGVSYCYDCVYDLEIEIINSCGAKVYGHSEIIGTLDNVNACSPLTATPLNTTIRLEQGDYVISKKLKVNETGIETYVNNFRERFTCRADTLLFMPDVDAACNPDCIACSLENTSAPFRRREGTNTDLAFNKRRAGNNSACQLACTQTGLSDVAMTFQAMLSEVSPGGQYAEYRDTARTEDRPAGVINPAAFPLSVLNDASQLPITNATWRNPAYNYQTQTGETALVLIGEIGSPAHRSPVTEIITRDGRQYVLVKYLNDVSEFIRLWEPQWAEALVVYHPEYEYYQWCVRNGASFYFDSLLTATKKYSDAVARSLTDYRNDPFLPVTAASLRADMEARLANAGTIAGSTVSAAQIAVLSVHCGNTNFSDAQFRDCYTTKTLYGTPGAQDKEWMVYKALYRKMKLRILSNERNRLITSTGGFNNRTIGGTRDVAANSLYSGKRRVFREEDDVMDELGFDFNGEEPTLAEVEEVRKRLERERYADCGVCPVGTDLMVLLNALNYEKRLTGTSVNLPGTSPLNLTKNLVNSFSNNTALQYNWSRINDPNPNILKVKITTGGTEMGILTLEKRRVDIKWDSLFILDCFKPTGELTFTLRIITTDEKVDTVRGRSTCFRLTGCTFNRACTATPARREMLIFMQYLFETNRYKRTLSTVHTHTSYSPYFGAALRSKHPNGQTWQWAFDGFGSPANTSFAARLIINEGRGALMATPVTCNFTFNVITPGFSLDSVGFVIAIRKPATLPSFAAVNNAELMVRSKGGRIFYIAMTNSCYDLFNCPADITNATPHTGMCCGPAPHTGLVINDCETSLRLIARREAERYFIARRDAAVDSVRGAYIRHCLNAVREDFTVAYNDAMYMATLHYYDLSGALIKTVPPKGVRTLNNAQIATSRRHRSTGTGPAVYPNHILETTYSYTSYGSLAEKSAPDEGTTKYAYDFAGRSILTCNAVQAGSGHATYTLYDAANRIIEGGRTNFSGSWQTFKNYSEFTGALSGQSEVAITRYDDASGLTGYFVGGQKGLRNRVSSVSGKSGASSSADTYVAAYSYDALGNVTRLVQHYPSLSLTGANAVKTADYTFDKLSGQITRVVYQEGKGDQFVHWYSYDANKRITQVQTSTSVLTPARLRDADARFNYYEHGPLARMETGNEKIQGVDYAYTIQGWLKATNGYTTGNGDIDMGKDGTSDGGLHAAGFPKDVTAQLLTYFEDDYKKIGTEGAQFYPESPVAALNSGFSKPVFNGSIQNSIVSLLQGFSADARKTFAQAYSYDQGNRLRQSQNLFSNTAGFEPAFSNQYSMGIDYDLNGNISTLSRTGSSGTAFDNLNYHYSDADNNNRLSYITDLGTSGTTDLRNQTTTTNYSYDALGRLTADASERITAIQYNNQSKVTAVNKSGSATTYTYDAFGRRISKTANGVTEWYVNDVPGSTMAVYSINGSEVKWKEAGIFGGRRLGVYKPDAVITERDMVRDSLIRGNKSYELTSHTGDVLAVVSDRKLNTADGATAEVQAAHNYFPFGMAMPGRSFGNSEYRYGFQGMESEDNLRGENNSYTTEYRQYDPRVGRWMSVDPKADKYADLSAYVGFLNNPVLVSDPRGDDPPVKKTFEQSMDQLPTTGNGPDDPIALGDELDFLFEDKPVEEPEERPQPRIRTGIPRRADETLQRFFAGTLVVPMWDGSDAEGSGIVSFEDDPEIVMGDRTPDFINLLGPLQTADDYYSAYELIRDPASLFGGLSETARSSLLMRLAVQARGAGFPQVARGLVTGSRVLPIISAGATTVAMVDCIIQNSTSDDPQIQGSGMHIRNGLCVVGGVVGVAVPFVQDPISNLLPTGRQQQDAVRDMIQEQIDEQRQR